MQMDLESVIRAVIEKRYAERIYFRDRIATELALAWTKAHPGVAEHLTLTFAARQTDAENLAGLEMLWEQVDELLSELEFAFPSQPEPDKTAKMWFHQPATRLDGEKEPDDSLSLEALSRCASLYLRMKWADSPTFECWVVRQMIYAEAFAFSREMGVPVNAKGFGFWWDLAKATVKWFIGLFVAFSVGESYGAGLGVLTYVAWVYMIHAMARDKTKLKLQILKIFLAMQTTYRVALRGNTYPIEVERHIALAELEGAVWPEGLRPIVCKAMARNPVAWAPPTSF